MANSSSRYASKAARLLGMATILATLLYGCAKEMPAPNTAPVSKPVKTLKVEMAGGLTKASLQSGANGQTVVWDAEDNFRVYNAATGECKTVNPAEISDNGFVATLPLPFEATDSLSIVVTYGAAEFRPDSTLAVSSPVEQPLLTGGHDCSAMPMSSVITRPDSNAVITLTPMNALVELTFSGIPNAGSDKVRNIHIETTMQKGTRSSNLTADNYIYTVTNSGFEAEISDYMSDKYIYKGSDYATYIELSSTELQPYNGGSLKTYFQAAPFVQPDGSEDGTYIKSILVSITTDKHIYTKTFSNVESSHIKMTSGRITRFELGMSGATQADRKGLSVIWSPGYLTYDAAAKRYTFAGPEERGLYFKLGSLMGFDPFSSVAPENYFGSSKKIVYYKYMDEDHSKIASDYDLDWSVGAADLKAYRKDSNGDIVPFQPSSWEELDYKKYSESPVCDYATNDPCSCVADANHTWRLPTADELQNLADVIQENLGNWRVWSLGSDDLNTVDHKPHMIEITDNAGQTFTLSTTSNMGHSHSLTSSGKYAGQWTYYVELGYSESIYLPSSTYHTLVTSKNVKYVGDRVFMIGTLTSSRAKYECDAKTMDAKNSYNAASDTAQGAMMVRCVRNK